LNGPPADRRFPWDALLGFAIAGLGLSPAEAWAATPRELSLAAGWVTRPGRDTPAQADLAALMARFPD
jgi:uncharacterized phage protein (TIGR02216 family)